MQQQPQVQMQFQAGSPQQYPPQQYPPQQYPPQQGYPQQYPPQQYPPQQYPPQQYPPQQYPPQQYPPQQYPPQQYPPQQYPTQQYPPQQYPPQQYPPQGYAQPVQPVYIIEKPKGKRGYERLEERSGIFIKQKFQLLEVLTGCEQNHTYYVYPLSKDGEQKGHKLLKCQEKSSFCSRQCMSSDCRPFMLKVNLEDDSEELDNEPFLLLNRPCRCTFYCLNRPEMIVTYVENGKDEYVGKIKDPWFCCNIISEIYDKDNNLKFLIEGSCLQVGMHCKGPLDCCQTIDFDIKSPSGEVISTLQKRSASCAAAMVSDTDNFAVNFPANATKEDKALIMSATLFLDFRFFEKKPNQQQNGIGFSV